jgi:hypothetical protein
MRDKLDRVEKDMEKASEKFVTEDVFTATIEPIKSLLEEIRKDVKALMVKVADRDGGRYVRQYPDSNF